MSTSPPIRALDDADLAQAHALTLAIRWPHREQDWRFALAMGRGWAIAEAGRLLGTAMSWAFGAERGCFGMLIVAPDQQGRGLGARLTEAALDGLGGRAVLLHATPAGEKLYRRLGFAPAGLVRQHQGLVSAAPPVVAPGLRDAVEADLPGLAALDAAAGGMDRARVLAAILAQGEAVVLAPGGTVSGFAMLRPFGRGEVIGPVVAPDAAGAWALIAALLDRRAGRFVRLDVADVALSPLLVARGLAQVDEALPMWRGTPPPPGGVARFALVNQALG